MFNALENLTNSAYQTYKKISDVIPNVIRYPYQIYKNNSYVNMNANFIAAVFPSITAAGLASEHFRNIGFSNLENTIATAIVDWGVFIPINIGLQYFSNKNKFLNDKSDLDIKAFAKYMSKIYRTQIPSILTFYLIAGPAHNLFLKFGMSGEAATHASYWTVLTVTRTMHTYTLWKEDKKNK